MTAHEHDNLSLVPRTIRHLSLSPSTCQDLTPDPYFPLRYPFGKDRTEHSGQFQRPVQKTHKFFNTLLQRIGVQFNFLTDNEAGDVAP